VVTKDRRVRAASVASRKETRRRAGGAKEPSMPMRSFRRGDRSGTKRHAMVVVTMVVTSTGNWVVERGDVSMRAARPRPVADRSQRGGDQDAKKRQLGGAGLHWIFQWMEAALVVRGRGRGGPVGS
jgi:hypothetical protein